MFFAIIKSVYNVVSINKEAGFVFVVVLNNNYWILYNYWNWYYYPQVRIISTSWNQKEKSSEKKKEKKNAVYSVKVNIRTIRNTIYERPLTELIQIDGLTATSLHDRDGYYLPRHHY